MQSVSVNSTHNSQPASNQTSTHSGTVPTSTSQTDTVSLSQEALEKYQAERMTQPTEAQKTLIAAYLHNRAEQLQQANAPEPETPDQPDTPQLPNGGEKLEQYVQVRKSIAQYNMYADMANLAIGNSNNLSPASAYYLANNDEAKSAVVTTKHQQMQINAMQTYVETSNSINTSV